MHAMLENVSTNQTAVIGKNLPNSVEVYETDLKLSKEKYADRYCYENRQIFHHFNLKNLTAMCMINFDLI